MQRKRDRSYREITAAVREVNRKRTFRNLGTPERADLDRAVLLLEGLSWKIAAEDMADLGRRIGATAKELKALAGKIDKKYKRLKSVSAALKKAANAAGRAAAVAGRIF